MLLCPFEDQCQGAAGQLSFQDFQRTDIDQCLELTIEGMEVRWGVIIPEHLDENAINMLMVGMVDTRYRQGCHDSGVVCQPQIIKDVPEAGAQKWGQNPSTEKIA